LCFSSIALRVPPPDFANRRGAGSEGCDETAALNGELVGGNQEHIGLGHDVFFIG
jgi:hypothetical protein